MVEEHVVVRTQTQYIVRGIPPMVWRTERPDVCSLFIRTGKTLQSDSAHLASVVVEGFDLSCLSSVSDKS